MLAKRFRSLSEFSASERTGYKLLPMRFTALDDHRYVISNYVGEFHVVDRSTLDRLVKHDLTPDDPVYYDLKSKHFLSDPDSSVASLLLGLKYRTKLSRFAQFTGLHMFVVTLRCDYSCSYCQVSRQTEDKAAFDMTPETARMAVDFMFRSPSAALKVEFQGGESLLNFPVIKEIVEYSHEVNRTKGRNLAFVIATNLSVLSDEILDYCDRYNILISTSLDGPAELHNTNRPRRGRNGHELTIEGIRRVQERLGVGAVSALMTTTHASLSRPREIVDEYVRLGLHEIFLRPMSPYGFAKKTGQIHKYDAERWLEFYKEALGYILEINKSGYALLECYSSLVLRKMLTPQNPGYVDLQSPSGLGISAIIYNYDGDIYAGDEARMLGESGDKTFRMGNLSEDDYEKVMLGDSFLDILESSMAQSAPICSECAFMPYCGADPVYHHETQQDFLGNKALSGYCHRNIGIFRHLIGLMCDSPEDSEILRRWAFPC